MALIYLVVISLATVVAAAVDVFIPLSWMRFVSVAAATAVIIDLIFVEILAGRASRGRASRPVVSPNDDGSPPRGTSLAAAWYVEAQTAGGRPPVSCSFVEFDERGDYLDFAQHRLAYNKIMALAKASAPLTVVIYVHGWRHNAQSANVLSFNEFLLQLSEARDSDDEPYRQVHGVYLAWRGGCLKPPVWEDKTFAEVSKRFGGSLVDRSQNARAKWSTFLLESASYFDRKSVPEHKSAGTSLSRTIFTCAFAATRNQPGARVLLMGHSFGGLMLERSFQNAAIGELTEAWPLGDPAHEIPANPLPFDTVLLVNSAAPSIYAKQFQSYFAAHNSAVHSRRPVIFSLTSTADWATGVAHRVANSLCGLVPTLKRKFRGGQFILEDVPTNRDVSISQAYYYRHTPGHNPLLVNRFIEPSASRADSAVLGAVGATSSRGSHVGQNVVKTEDPTTFTTTGQKGHGDRQWKITFPPITPEFVKFSSFKGRRPVVWTKAKNTYLNMESGYWIIRCTGDIIHSHDDIWSQAAMETYAALHRIGLSNPRQSR